MISVETCPLCGNSTFQSFSSCIDHSTSQEKFDLQNCLSCDFVFTSPRPDENTLSNYYASASYISHTNKANSLINRLYLIARRRTLQWKISLLQKYSNTENVKILDYGCGTGEFLHACKEKNWNVNGIEPSSTARDQAAKKTQVQITSSIAEQLDNDFDIITLWHVLEHVSNLTEITQQLKTKLKSTGVLIIAVPNHKSWDAKHYKEYWAGYDVPRHLWHFSQKNIEQLTKNTGLKIVASKPMLLDAFYISLLSEKYRSNNKTTAIGLIKAFLNGLISNVKAKKNNEYSSLIYIISK